MDNGARLLGAIGAFAFWQFVFWPFVGRTWKRLRESRDGPTIGDFMGQGTGHIYESATLDRRLGDLASEAISHNRYVVRSHHQNRGILILKTSPRYVITIERMPSLHGGAPDIIIQSVYDPYPKSAEDVADDLAEMAYD